jgi:hypothetical protein
MEGASTLAYYNMATITADKGLIVQAPGISGIKMWVGRDALITKGWL